MPQPPVIDDSNPVHDQSLPGHYRVLHCLGEGGFGEVFEAWDDKLRRSVAIKRLKNITDAAQSARLVQEAQLAASLRHAAFVKIYALEGDDSSQSIVMELVRGQTLRRLLSDAPPDERQSLAIVRQIAEAMREAHDSGLIHGDLKPSNVMIEPSGTVRILDFGLASQADTQATVTMATVDPQGTIAYMAPERMLGHSMRAQCDIYALGVILYELLTGARPFAELSGLALAAAHVQSSADRWPYPPEMNPELVKLVQAMAASSVEKRLQTMKQVCERLSVLDGVALGSTARVPLSQLRIPAKASWWPARKRQVIAGGWLAVLFGGAWLAAPYVPSVAEIKAAIQPYSEAVEMREGLQAVRMWDRPHGLDEAEKHFMTVLEHSPNNAAAVAGMAMVYVYRYGSDHQDEIWLRKARAAAQQALKLNDQVALSHIALATVLLMEGKAEDGLVEYNRAFGLDPENVFALYGKVNALNKLRQTEAALENAEANIRRYPNERVFADQIGTIFYSQSRYKEAEAAFRQSIRIQPDAVMSYANLSAALASQNRPEEALQVLQEGLQVRPSEWLYGNLGNMLFLRGDYVGAADAFAAAVAPNKGNPADYLGWANLADTLLWIPGKKAEAAAAYARASELLAPRLAREPNEVTLVSRMSLYFARSGNKKKCEEMLLHALTLAPNDAYVHFRAGMAYELIGERKKALDAIVRAVKLGYPVKFIESTPELVELRRDLGYGQVRQ